MKLDNFLKMSCACVLGDEHYENQAIREMAEWRCLQDMRQVLTGRGQWPTEPAGKWHKERSWLWVYKLVVLVPRLPTDGPVALESMSARSWDTSGSLQP